MIKNEKTNDVLIIGAGITGIEASLTLSKADRTVYLIEKSSITGGNTIKFEEVFPNMECSTCMIAPRQQELLQDKNIHLITLAIVEKVEGTQGNFTVEIKKKARYVNMDNCIGCNACFDPCPVTLKNEFEEGLNERKAIYVPCAGALPNVPMIDSKHCLRFTGQNCTACQEACMFEAIDYKQKDESLTLNVEAIIVATGYRLLDPKQLQDFTYTNDDDVYSSFEFERLYASNGPTEGTITLKNGKTPKKVAIIHCVGRNEQGYCSSVCCMYSLKFIHYLKSKIPDIQISEFYTDLCIPGKSHQKFYDKMQKNKVDMIRYSTLSLKKQGKNLNINYTSKNNTKKSLPVDMIILAPAILPDDTSADLAKKLGISLDEYGFFNNNIEDPTTIITSKPGVYIAGCSQGAKNIQDSIAQGTATVGKILSSP